VLKRFIIPTALFAAIGAPAAAQEFSPEDFDYFAMVLGHVTVGIDACEHYTDQDSAIVWAAAFLDLVLEAGGTLEVGAKMLEDSKSETLGNLRREGRTQWCEVRLPLFMKWAVDDEITNSIFPYGFE
jgi:hypothetical protein